MNKYTIRFIGRESEPVTSPGNNSILIYTVNADGMAYDGEFAFLFNHKLEDEEKEIVAIFPKNSVIIKSGIRDDE